MLRRSGSCVVLALACLAGCRTPGDREGDSSRLGPDAFGVATDAWHGPVVQIGDEARAVLAAPQVLTMADVSGVRVEIEPVTVAVTLPPEARDLPDDAFTLSAKRVPVEPPRHNAARAGEILWRRLTDWHITRDPSDPAAAALVVQPYGTGIADMTLQLRAFAPLPTPIESRPIDIPAGARLAFAYGLANPPRARSVAVEFSASLACGSGTRPVFRGRVETEKPEALGWHDTVTESLPAARDCRLRLAVDGGTGSPVWAVPRIVAAARPRDERPPNLVLISLDTLRADHLSGYGYARPTSPAIDARLIGLGTTFDDVATTFPLTNVAHMSLFTGLYPDAALDAASLPASSPATTLAELLQNAGFLTAAFTEGGLIAGPFGFWTGFDRYAEYPAFGPLSGFSPFRDGAEFVRRHRDEPFFVFLHTYKVHAPYDFGDASRDLFADPADWSSDRMDPHVPLAQRTRVDAYDRTIHEADVLVAHFLDELEALGIAERTFVVLLSDHGEAFGEHGLLEHGLGGHEEQLRVPLVIRGPGVAGGRRRADTASLVDVLPTVLDLLGLPPAAQAQGTSLRAAREAERPTRPRAVFFSWLVPGAHGVRYGRWKLMDVDGRAEIYDLSADPREHAPQAPPDISEFPVQDLVTAHRADNAARKQAFAAKAATTPAGPPTVSGMVERSLRLLGYL